MVVGIIGWHLYLENVFKEAFINIYSMYMFRFTEILLQYMGAGNI